MSYLKTLPQVQVLLKNANHFDEKSIESTASLREFIAGALNFAPAWVRGLYAIRAIFVRVLGMRQASMALPDLTPEQVSFTPNDHAFFFKVSEGTTDTVWIARADDDHLTAYLVIAQVPNTHRYDVGTIVHYHKWTGPVYFNVIRPFHHVVVWQMMQAGASYRPKARPADDSAHHAHLRA